MPILHTVKIKNKKIGTGLHKTHYNSIYTLIFVDLLTDSVEKYTRNAKCNLTTQIRDVKMGKSEPVSQ
jgi:hypothetical protein